MVGLHYLKALYDESDETVVAKWGRESVLAIFLRGGGISTCLSVPSDEFGEVAKTDWRGWI